MEGGSLRAVRISRTTVQYSEGQEIAEPAPIKVAKTKNADQGLKTWGAFGPVLGLVLVDAAQNKLAWGHWEQGANGTLAVFRYSVPKDNSHYEVRYCCVAASYGMESNSFNVMSGYHGEIAVDPASGVIVRVTLQAELTAEDPISRADLAVEYGPVELGGTKYICPQRSVSSPWRGPSGTCRIQRASWLAMGPVQMLLNHVDFDQFTCSVPRRACFRAPRNGPPGWPRMRRYRRRLRPWMCSLRRGACGCAGAQAAGRGWRRG